MSQRAIKRREAKALTIHQNRFIPSRPVKMNKTRQKILKYISANMAKYYEEHDKALLPLKDYLTEKSETLFAAKEFNQEWLDRSRGKGGKKKPHGVTFIKSVACSLQGVC